MSIDDLAGWISETPLAYALTDSEWSFGTVEAVHVIALTLVFGSIALVDLRLVGLVQTNRDPAGLLRQWLPFTWAGFVVAALTGTTMIFANPQGYFSNVFFQGKLVLLVLAGLNMAVFHFVGSPRLATPGALAPRLSGAISLVLWTTIIAFGRWIGFTI